MRLRLSIPPSPRGTRTARMAALAIALVCTVGTSRLALADDESNNGSDAVRAAYLGY